MRTYEAWDDPSDSSVTLATAERIAEMRAKGLLSPAAQLLFTIVAETYEEAAAIHHLRLGWGPYRPNGEPAPCPGCGAWFYPEGSGECWKCLSSGS